ncbi:MAG: 50S ribosomal protein L17 [Candidatus Omnitrophica bacterium]|jgi:large subunit ribosomal protein L17|nr:50S ribosomal protein L17 [Candidatus Omnitrophota bacterium]
MRHKKLRHQLNRFTSWHKATIISLARNILIQQSIKTTVNRAKAARPLVEKLIGLAKENTLAAKRSAFSILGDHKLVVKLFNEIGPRFSSRTSGFSRIMQFGQRRGDNAQMAIFELTEIKKEIKKAKKSKEVKQEDIKKTESTKEEQHKEAQFKEERPPVEKEKKPQKKFLGGLKNIFKKERDAL